MRSIRPILFSTLFASFVVSPLAACGGDDGGDDGTDGDTPAGTHYKYVASVVDVPETPAEPKAFSIDLDADGTADNKIGTALTTLGIQLGTTFAQDPLTKSINDGTIIVLADLQTEDFSTAAASGISFNIGGSPMPSPCTDASDMTCGHHLDGTGMFTIDTSAGTSTSLNGAITGGTLAAGPGKFTLKIALGASPVPLHLVGAKIEATGISEAGFTAKVAGAVTKEEFEGTVLPGIKTAVVDPILMESNCSPTGNPTADPPCGCTAGSKGVQLLGILELPESKDCVVTVSEIQNGTLKNLIAMDMNYDAATNDFVDEGEGNAISIGVKITTVKASF